MHNKKLNLADSDVPSLLTVAHKFGDWIINLLNFYLVINAALIGWMFAKEQAWSQSQKIFVIIVYIMAMITNIIWVNKLKCWLIQIISQIEDTAIFKDLTL